MEEFPEEDFVTELNAVFSQVIEKAASAKHMWDEDFITREWLWELQNLINGTSIVQGERIQRINCSTYKLSGNEEKDHGDVLFRVKHEFPNGKASSGTAFLEAKKFDYGGTGLIPDYKRARVQLERHLKFTHAHHLVLYACAGELNQHVMAGVPFFALESLRPPADQLASITAIPTRHALDHGGQDTTVLDISFPLSYQIICRFLRGLDLDYASGDLGLTTVVRGRPKFVVDLRLETDKRIDGSDAATGGPPHGYEELVRRERNAPQGEGRTTEQAERGVRTEDDENQSPPHNSEGDMQTDF